MKKMQAEFPNTPPKWLSPSSGLSVPIPPHYQHQQQSKTQPSVWVSVFDRITKKWHLMKKSYHASAKATQSRFHVIPRQLFS